MTAKITNALIRCTRADEVPLPAFERRKGMDLWVRELPENFSGIVENLSEIRPLLRKLGTGSLDYTLHLAATIDELHSMAIPPSLAEIAGDCGFLIELIATPS